MLPNFCRLRSFKFLILIQRRLFFQRNHFEITKRRSNSFAVLLVKKHICQSNFESLAKFSLAASAAWVVAQCSSNKNQGFKLFRTTKFGSAKELQRILTEDGFDVNFRHFLGWTALHLAAVSGQYENVKVLLDHGADVNAGDEFINVYRTASEKGMHTLDVLVQRESEFSDLLRAQENYHGFTALHYAVLVDNIEIVTLLLERGANPTIEASGHLPANLTKNEKIKSVLQQYAEKYDLAKKFKDAEERRKFPIEQRLKQYIVGQEAAIAIVASAIRRKENGWADDEHPLVFLFLGSSGIGKTELAKQLARYIHKDKPEAFIRLDMSEYQEKHEVAKLIGAPPGYIGHDQGGQLTKRLRACPNAVVLLDEVDKAHPDVLTVLLQLFDEGRLTDGKGKTIECKDAIFVMTSNLASEEIADHAIQLRGETEKINAFQLLEEKEELREPKITITNSFKDIVVRPILKKHFGRDEFLGRINEIVYFLPFSHSELNKLVSKELEFWAQKAITKHKIELKWEHGVETVLAGGYNIRYGARSIKHEVERRVVSQLAAAQEAGLLRPGATINLTVAWPKSTEQDAEPTIKFQLKQHGLDEFVELSDVAFKEIDQIGFHSNLF